MRSHRRTAWAWRVLVVAGACGLAAGCELAVGSWQAEQREPWTRDYAAQAGSQFELTNTNGPITVAPSADARLHVRAEKIARGATDESAREALKQIEIVEEVDGAVVRLRTRTQTSGMFGRNGSVAYSVQVPPSMKIRVENTNGRIELEGLEGAVDVETTNGGIRGRNLRGAVRAESTNGGVELELASVADGGVDVSTTNGGVTLTLPETAKADLSASCTNGGIDTSGLSVETVESSKRKLEARLNGGGPRIRAQTTNGGIRFTRRTGT